MWWRLARGAARLRWTMCSRNVEEMVPSALPLRGVITRSKSPRGAGLPELHGRSLGKRSKPLALLQFVGLGGSISPGIGQTLQLLTAASSPLQNKTLNPLKKNIEPVKPDS